jgi:hypothetical protein
MHSWAEDSYSVSQGLDGGGGTFQQSLARNPDLPSDPSDFVRMPGFHC